jgi:hypothetical protein
MADEVAIEDAAPGTDAAPDPAARPGSSKARTR